jgi:SAM-dependent methyltransferase
MSPTPPAARHATSWRAPEEGARYERGRPGYPAAIADLLSGHLGLGPGTQVADVAAGTGKLTRRLTGTGARVTAVEPMPGMRAQLRSSAPAAEVVSARAEHLPFASGTVDAVTVAQAFHWFAVPEASRELRRVLRPGGHLVLVTNHRVQSPPWVRALWDVLGRYERLAPRPPAIRDWRLRLERSGQFGPFQRFSLANEQRFSSLEDLEARFASISFVILLPEEARASLLRDLHEVVDGVDPLVVPLQTEIAVATPTA